MPVAVTCRRSGPAVDYEDRAGLAIRATWISGGIGDLVSGNINVSIDDRRQAEGGGGNRARVRCRWRCNGKARTVTVAGVVRVIGGCWEERSGFVSRRVDIG